MNCKNINEVVSCESQRFTAGNVSGLGVVMCEKKRPEVKLDPGAPDFVGHFNKEPCAP